MTKCNFNINFTEPVDKLIEKAKNGITSIGGTFEGNMKKGIYSIPTQAGKVTGNYLVKENSIVFEIIDKPALVSCKKIENELRKYLSSTSEALLSFD
ncbi:hypothetical protein [Flavobacterium chungangense]|uniref:Uncharacterized protein n=1 Tax=Flavobacterium chungangense TaxID=554283 RepID=A0A6V6ZF01_9FLAO|nr:hypothetical protein [Flavobacterium chungangense]CAD0009462.1 hypothetical protein FLACHUCJ7_04250 [Flavobacterium chungangense]